MDAKSIMGIFSVDLSEPVELEVHGGDDEACAKFFGEIAPYIVKQ